MVCPNCHSEVSTQIAFCPECGARLLAPSQPLRVLQGRYELTRKLGQGGMGAVYLASDRRLSTVRWAVKEMSDGALTSPLERQQAAEAFKHEAELLARLSHPNLPRVTDHFTEDGKNYLVMEFVAGETLLAYSQQHGLPLPLPQALEWARQLCDVLEYLHRQNPPVIFRDLKPANVMLTPEGQLKLIDFGIARLFKPGQARDTQAYGTMGYSAPEQYGRGQTDARSDVYSLGVLLHHLLTGHDPASTPFNLPPASQLNPQVPPPLAAALAQATATNAEQRFPGIAAFRQALSGSGSLVQMQPASQPLRAGMPQPASQPFAAPRPATGPQPFAAPHTGSQPLAPQAATTGLARSSYWIGLFGLVLVAVSVIVTIIALTQRSSTMAGVGLIVGGPGLLASPLALMLSFIALARQSTQATLHGRRHAIIGAATGVAALPLCCVTFLIFGAIAS